MKKILFIAMAFASMLFASCMGDGYADPDNTIKVPAAPVGDNNIKEKNVITIAQLKEDYNSLIANKRYEQIDKDIQIKGYITGNDLGGNLYNEVCLQDETGGILVCINKGALYGELPVGQQILINLKGLYIGGYGSQADGKAVYAPETEKDKTNCVNRNLTDAETKTPISASNLLVRTSAYAKFANVALPKDPVNITGIFTRFNNVWQILIRTSNDVETALNVTGGTKEEPYTVTNALKLINAGKYTTDKVYTTGIICEVSSVDTGSYGNATYSISEDGKAVAGKMIKVFRGFNLDNQKWTEETKGTLAVGKKVVIYGTLTMYNGTPEIDKENYLISIK